MRNLKAEIDNTLTIASEHRIKSCLAVSNQNQWKPGTGQTVTDLCQIGLTLRREIKNANSKNFFASLPYQTLNRFLNIFNQWGNEVDILASGNNNIDTFTAITNEFHAFWFENGLSRKSPKILDFESKLGELTKLESDLLKAVSLLEEANSKFENSLENAEKVKLKITSLDDIYDSFHDILRSIQNMQSECTTNLNTIRQAVQQSNADSSTAKAKLIEINDTKAEVEIIRDSLEAFRERVKAAYTLLDSISANATETIDTSEKRIHAQSSRLVSLEKQIMAKLQLAVGESLFKAFEKRREAIETRFNLWRNAGLYIFCLGMTAVVILAFLSTTYDIYFYLKVALIIPIVSITAFCFNQYTKERRIAEEYAFKSAVSVSLEAYRDMIEKSIDVNEKDERAKYTEFLTHSVSTIFDPPTDRVFADRKQRGPTDLQLAKNVIESLKPIIDTFKISS